MGAVEAGVDDEGRSVGEAACWRYDACASTRTERAGGARCGATG